ncbi:DNA-methyltransferase [Oerskovia jenensis]|uniref:DNA-methyltransferase n=1 Tax=Oerskovia jenensis TaxID=162169 RepID=UPI0036D767A0
MTTPYYRDEHVTLWHGDAVATLAQLEPGSVDCVVTSPPYFGLRDYAVEGQIGLEESPAEYVASLVAVFREVRRVLAADGTVWLNLGDSYSGGGAGGGGKHAAIGQGVSMNLRNSRQHYERMGLGPKNLLGIPWRVAFALQDDGWTLRNDIIWTKPNAMPESVTDRLSGRHEHVFMLTTSAHYWFDLESIRQPYDGERALSRRAHRSANKANTAKGTWAPVVEKGRNPGDVWELATQPFPGAHFATMPPALAERCVQAGCRPGGTVLDPFSGSGTTGLAAGRHGRRYVGIDLNREYLDLSLETRLQQPYLSYEVSS